MIKALFKFAKIPDLIEGQKPIVIDTTSNSGNFAQLSPFILPAPPANRFENLWQFSKVYKQHIGDDGLPNQEWWIWRDWGFAQTKAYHYPMGKGAIPEYSYWHSEKLDYIQARKRIYAFIYAKNVRQTEAYEKLAMIYHNCLLTNKELILLDYDAYDHVKLGMSLINIINNPNRKMGHAFVLIMMLTGMLQECINS